MSPKKFERWKSLFSQTVDEHFVGEKAEYIKCIANDMAQVTQSKNSGIPRGMTFAPDPPRPKDS